MLIINIKDNETIDRALKRYKRKYQKTGILKEIRNRRYFEKPSVSKRFEYLKAVYKEQKKDIEE
ncbi:MAG: 30S ribosomal protein S21 [Saprospirales bacterium]|nr:30S ribosomal protein S21 [Saprospirales bacterium]MBK8493042.1 30S ribosomal protein S21 [Saprospirales bacterium]